jgi:methyl-accepting chemotaxis protein
MVEEQTVASHSLAREADALFKLLEQFKFDNGVNVLSNREPSRRPVTAAAVQPTRKAAPLLPAGGSAALAVSASEWEDF